MRMTRNTDRIITIIQCHVTCTYVRRVLNYASTVFGPKHKREIAWRHKREITLQNSSAGIGKLWITARGCYYTVIPPAAIKN